MANKQLFSFLRGRNDAQAPAYEFTPRHALAQYAATGALLDAQRRIHLT